MTAISDPRSGGLSAPVPTVNYNEPPVKPPPILAVGPLAWIRNNLFSSLMDTILTIVATLVGVTVIAGVINWTVHEANWFIINYNLRLLMLGRYEPAAEWRVQLVALLVAAVAGFAIAAWARLSRTLAGLLVVAVAVTFIVPPLVERAVPLPPMYVTAGSVDITSGTATETPLPRLAFIARAGETVTLTAATELAAGDEALRGLHGFADNGANLLRGAAVNRLQAQARIDEIEALLRENRTNGPTLTATQLAALTAELENLTVVDPVVDTYALNQSPVQVRLVRATTMDPIAEEELTANGATLSVTLPDDGWYLLESAVDAEDSAALLRAEGVFPLLQREFSRSEVLDDEGNVISSSGRTTQFVRLTDGFTTEEARPRLDGRDVPMTIIFDNTYRGTHSLGDYLRLYLAPFFDLVNEAFLLIVAALILGYAAGSLLKQRTDRSRVTQRVAFWLLSATPVLMFVLIYGVGGPLPLTDTRRWGGLMLTIILTVVSIIASFPLGLLLALGRRSSLPVVRAACTIYIETVRGVPLLTVLFMAQLLVPLLNPSLAEFPNIFRAMVGITLFSAAYLAENVRGGLQAVPPGQEEAAKALGMSSLAIILFITLPQALRAVIPALVGQFISLFKDTSLVAIVGLIDLTGISEVVVAQTEFLGLRREAFIFITLVYFSISYLMAFVSRRIEESGAGVARRF